MGRKHWQRRVEGRKAFFFTNSDSARDGRLRGTVLRPCPGSSFCCLLRLECHPIVPLGLREWLECELDLLTQYDPKKVCFLGSC